MGRNKLGECPLLFSKYLHLHTKDLTLKVCLIFRKYLHFLNMSFCQNMQKSEYRTLTIFQT